ncbi:hypothetical protein CC53_gp011 [Rhizobium phage vB_RleS_L338C]|uniref:hypothetical protein n=1 Tax=Rhizobium phage vB_RleS_L338C TaxID=1414737 RepID=UPI0003D930D1|nr:hypothetical protein CC53_gp011 [Rhizobium phage vB_RleS_L338C]AHC30428.1 hypothetical protein L338C_011 [Rhizobium phage vB_RleS_L338C]
MSETRTRVRRPDAPAEENNVAEETVIAESDVATVALVEEAVSATPLQGPFRRDGFHIVDAAGRRIVMAGVEGDIVRTGPGIAEACSFT